MWVCLYVCLSVWLSVGLSVCQSTCTLLVNHAAKLHQIFVHVARAASLPSSCIHVAYKSRCSVTNSCNSLNAATNFFEVPSFKVLKGNTLISGDTQMSISTHRRIGKPVCLKMSFIHSAILTERRAVAKLSSENGHLPQRPSLYQVKTTLHTARFNCLFRTPYATENIWTSYACIITMLVLYDMWDSEKRLLGT